MPCLRVVRVRPGQCCLRRRGGRFRQVAAHLGVCAATVYKLCERGELGHVRVSNAIRIAPVDVEGYVSRHWAAVNLASGTDQDDED